MTTDFGPRPEMVVLAHLLDHPALDPDADDSALFATRAITRANEDLGRVLAIARLSDDSEIAAWPAAWENALRMRFPADWESRAAHVGAGLRALLASERDMADAHAACVNGLLASRPITVEQLRITGLRLIQDAIEPLEQSAGGWDHSPPG